MLGRGLGHIARGSHPRFSTEGFCMRDWHTYARHPLSAAFPSMPQSEIEDLASDIKSHGQRDAGVLYEGQILDGWHRYLACQLAEVEFLADNLPDNDDPVAFVIAKNAHRRQLTASQRAVAIAVCLEWRNVGRPNNSASVAEYSATTQKIADSAGVSARTVERAKVAIRAGLGDAVRDGMISVAQAEKLATIDESAPEEKPDEPKQTGIEKAYAELQIKYAELKEASDEIADIAASATIFEDRAEFKVLTAMQAELRAVKKRRDELMRENAELKKDVMYWRKRAGVAA